MNCRRFIISSGVFLLASGLAEAQKKKEPAPVSSGAVIQSEAKLVVVDVVATDKKGGYVGNLEAKDFRVWEDNKEQTIKSFSAGAEVAPTRYLILFFDSMNLTFADQSRARQFAAQFAQAVAGETRRMAVIDFENNLRIVQDFTGNVDRLTSAIKSVRMSMGTTRPGVSSNTTMGRAGSNTANMGMPSFNQGGFGSGFLVLSLKELAKNLNSVPGRKTMIWFSGGFQADNTELQGMLDVFNRSNVGIFPVDMASLTGIRPVASIRPPSGPGKPSFLQALFSPILDSAVSPTVLGFQRSGPPGAGAPGGGAPPATPGGGGGPPTAPGGGGSTPGGTAPGRAAPGGVGNSFPSTNSGNSGNSRPSSVPEQMGNPSQPNMREQRFPNDNSFANRQTLATLADKTGGFLTQYTDTMEGLAKIGREQESFYVLGYTPPPSEEGTCHSLKVKVSRSGVNLRSRSTYCNARPSDLLAGNPIEKELENKASGTQQGNLAAAIRLPFFYTAENVARVNAAMEIALGNLKFEKVKGKPHAALHVLGTAYSVDGAIAARFSDMVNLDFDDQAAADQFKQNPYHYENQFEIAPGTYTLKVVFSSSRDTFGKLEASLVVSDYKPSQFALSALALSTQFKRATNLDLSGGVSLLGDNIPLVAAGLQVIPSGTNQFSKNQNVGFYCEIYEPLLVMPDPNTALAVGVQVRVFERNTGLQKADTGVIRIDVPPKSDSPTIRLGLKAPLEGLEAGSYFLELTATDTKNQVAKRSTAFEIR